MSPDAPGDVTDLLRAHQAGEADALDRLMPKVYDRLRRIAHGHLRGESPGHTLDTSALVHEAYLGMVEQGGARVQDRIHFFALASRAMRNLLIDHARAHATQKRGGGTLRTTLDERTIAVRERADDLLALDQALDRLAGYDPRLARVVEYRFFGGMSVAETAAALDVSAMTVHRDWQKARAWLLQMLDEGPTS